MTASHGQAEARHIRRETEPEPPQNKIDFRSILPALPSAAYLTDADGLITDFNRRAVELWGREPKRNNPSDRY